MSYIRSYSSSINVTGSVNVHYPASEHGGTTTVHYQQNVPVTVNITVATTPFDKSISNADKCVNGLTASVAAMNAANCAAIVKCSEQISDSLVSGFYNLIQSDISAKKAEESTAIQTKSALLLQHSKAVQDKHERMLTDVEREQAKFGKVFKELDRELERRVNEIDGSAFRLGKKVREDIVIKPYLSSAAVTVNQIESESNSRESIAIAGLRQKVSVVLRNLFDALHNNLRYRNTISNILWDKSIDEEQQFYVPVAYFVSDDVANTRSVCQCYASDNASRNSILAAVNSYVTENNNLEAKAIPVEEMKFIDQAFSSMVQDRYINSNDHNEYHERVYAEICRLWKVGCSTLKQI